MTTYYIDFENGNDANAGTSFATRWKTITNGATAARIAPGDTIRIMASPDPTSIGNATWTGGGRPVSRTIASSTNATPIVITTSAAHGLVPGDYVSIVSHSTNTNANGIWKVGTTPTSTTFQILQINGSNTTGNGTGSSGNFTKVNNLIVKTATPLVQNIALCGGLGQKPAWTASANVTTSIGGTTAKEGYSAAQISIAAAFTTGKAAYYTLPSTLNLSGYQQVSFWVQLTTGTVGAAGQTYLALCSDTTGDTVVHQCPVPSLGAVSVWVPVTVNLGTNLNSAIRSVAFYVVTDVGAQTFYLDNIIACKAASAADSVTLQSLVSKSDGTGDEAWYPIQSINYDAIMLANNNSALSTSTSLRGYTGTSETVTTYKRETIKTPIANSTSTQVSIINDSGNSANSITFSGGWNRTDMSTQTGRTWLDGLNGYGNGLYSVNSYVDIDKIDFCRYESGIYYVATTFQKNIGSIYVTACSTGVTFPSSANLYLGSVWANNNSTGVLLNSTYGVSITDVKNASNNQSYGVDFQASGNCNIVSALASNCGTSSSLAGVRFTNSSFCSIDYLVATDAAASSGITCTASSMVSVNGGYTSGNVRGVIVQTGGQLFLNNFTINESSEVVPSTTAASFVYSNRHDDTDNNSWVWFGGLGTINQQTSVVDSPATTSWLMRPTALGTSAINPIRLKLGTVVCAANSLVTVTARMRRSNTGLTMRLCCPGGQISGVSSDVTSDMTAAANTWETVTITFTPTKPGGVDIYAYAFGGTTFSGYVCNLTASQA